jgi:hypothetical protein
MSAQNAAVRFQGPGVVLVVCLQRLNERSQRCCPFAGMGCGVGCGVQPRVCCRTK